MSLLLLFNATPAGPVEANLSVIEANDGLTASATLDVRGDLAATEANDVTSAASALTITSSAFITEADDVGVSSAILAIAAFGVIAEGDDVPSTSGTVDIVGSLAAVERDDVFIAQGALGIEASLTTSEEDDTLFASALMPIWYPRRGGDDEWAQYERRQIEWQEQLRRIIDRSWRIANDEIDPITFEPIPPPDYSVVIGELINQALTLDQARAEAFVAEQERLQEVEAISMLLLAA